MSQPSPEFLEELKRYPVRLAMPVLFGAPISSTQPTRPSSGSGCFVDLSGRLLAVTCQHVLAGYRRRLEEGPTFFQFGPILFDPEKCIVGESVALDLVTFDVTSHLHTGVNGVERRLCVSPTQWPPREIDRENDVLAFAGFPGIWREQPDRDYFRFYSLSCATVGVESLAEQHLWTSLRLSESIIDRDPNLELGSLGGLSGGPVFAWRKTPILIAELVGFITEYQEGLDLLHVRRACCINADGTLVAPL